ncbi:hypothetical protein [Sphingomonas sp. CLY1604]|uniref:hypothetical protein n=1 Tax=Sphingomonas sp. CLY1604 TaxID=3457786 RepID=UPI003FD84432
MRYPAVSYQVTTQPDYLVLNLFDGTCREVVFESRDAAGSAMSPGRAEIDAAAVTRGFLPLGATIVARARVSADADLPDALARRIMDDHLAASRYITPGSDAAARLLDPVESARYDGLARRSGVE